MKVQQHMGSRTRTKTGTRTTSCMHACMCVPVNLECRTCTWPSWEGGLICDCYLLLVPLPLFLLLPLTGSSSSPSRQSTVKTTPPSLHQLNSPPSFLLVTAKQQTPTILHRHPPNIVIMPVGTVLVTG